jgi:hypothetical protein
MVMMFVRGVVLLFDRILVLILLEKCYGAGVFCSRPNPYCGKAVNRCVRPFYTACRLDELSRGSVSCLLNASFKKQFHNATT